MPGMKRREFITALGGSCGIFDFLAAHRTRTAICARAADRHTALCQAG